MRTERAFNAGLTMQVAAPGNSRRKDSPGAPAAENTLLG